MAGGAGALYMAGEDAKKELAGDETAGTGLAGLARKHPIASSLLGASAVLTGTHAIKKLFKKATFAEPKIINKEFVNEYKAFLENKAPEDLLLMIERMPDEVIQQLICL